MSAHTPGPWTSERAPNGVEWDVDAGVWAVAICMDAPGDGTAEANARLIAAAPELLDALKGVLRVADRKTDEFDAARAAIRKAEGK